MLRYPNDNFFPHRARKWARRVEDPYRMPCRVRKEVKLEPPAMARIRKKRKQPSPYFQKKKKISRMGVICAPSSKHGIVPIFSIYNFLNISLFFFFILRKLSVNMCVFVMYAWHTFKLSSFFYFYILVA